MAKVIDPAGVPARVMGDMRMREAARLKAA
jgi:hypothetical protein